MNLLADIAHPKWIVIQLEERCNLRCKMCYEWGDNGSYFGKEKLVSLDYPVIERAVKALLPGKPFFGLFGGEPLMYPHLEELIKLIKSGDCNVDIPTNGTLLEKKAEMLVEAKPNRLWISLDGPPEINDSQRGQGVFEKVMRGIDRLYEVRAAKGSIFPKIGVTFIVTPLTYRYIEEFFLSCLNLSKVEHISIEFQTYSTAEQHLKYAEVLKTKFGIDQAPVAAGTIQDPAIFAEMDFASIVEQMLNVKAVCEQRGIYFVAYPKTIQHDNVRNFFTANWQDMVDKRTFCAFPWLYNEISARGDVTVCHTFYDLPVGNIHEEDILDIWKGERIKQVRDHLRKNLFPICTACARYYADPTKH
jgi:radical SAM protein with 4Fe4S-binding SPASM domain